MRVNNTSVFVGGDTTRTGHGEQSNTSGIAVRASDKTSNGKSIDGSALQAKFDPVSAKKEEAKKKAMKIVGDAFANERKMDDELGARRERIKALQEEKGYASGEIKRIEDKRVALRDDYAIEEDSQEEKDLKLLEKEVRSRFPGSGVQLSKDEMDAIQKIKKNGLTEYQQRSLEMLGHEAPYVDMVYEADKEIKLENQIVRETKLERLKSHTMEDAQKQAEEVLEAASKEAIGMMVDEAKEHIDEEAEEREEKAEAEKEKQEEIEARIDAAKEKKKENEELTEDILEKVQEVSIGTSDVNAAQQEIKDMMSKMKLIEEDIKGAAVDQNI